VSYVLAAFGVTLGALLAYGLRLAAESRRLRDEIARLRANGG
jgi:hypothetical protein